MPGSICSTNPDHICVLLHQSVPPPTACQGTVPAKAGGQLDTAGASGWGTDLQPWGPRAQPWDAQDVGSGQAAAGQHKRQSETKHSPSFLHAMGHRGLGSPPGNLNETDVTKEPPAAGSSRASYGVCSRCTSKMTLLKRNVAGAALAESVPHTPRASKPRSSLRLCLTQKPSVCSVFVLISQ